MSTWALVIHDVRSVYDADNQILQVHIPPHGMPARAGVTSSFQSMWSKFESRESSYIGTNALGAVAQVKNTLYTVHLVAFGNTPSFPTATVKDGEYFSRLAIHASVSLGPDAAKQMKPELSALAVCRLTAPFTMSDYYSDVATVSRPYASQNRDNYVMTELLEVWVHDRKSGVIHAKITARD